MVPVAVPVDPYGADMDNRPYRTKPGFRRVSIAIPADLVVRIDLLAVTRSDYPHRAELIADAIRLYLAQHEGTPTPPTPGT